jgi:hypothetical protein
MFYNETDEAILLDWDNGMIQVDSSGSNGLTDVES